MVGDVHPIQLRKEKAARAWLSEQWLCHQLGKRLLQLPKTPRLSAASAPVASHIIQRKPRQCGVSDRVRMTTFNKTYRDMKARRESWK